MTQLISLENVSVRFRIYHNPSPSLKDLFVNRMKKQGRNDDFSDFFALNNISLDIKPGDRLGLVGLNGAGKSTLLKTIAGIYPPHQGKLQVNGRITPLMELGAGFNPEQTGRQNIFLNGALLGYSPSEMLEKQDSIIEFSELQEFMDMPVKYYSSGMYGRLAFSIATMTDPEILLIDEVFVFRRVPSVSSKWWHRPRSWSWSRMAWNRSGVCVTASFCLSVDRSSTMGNLKRSWLSIKKLFQNRADRSG